MLNYNDLVIGEEISSIGRCAHVYSGKYNGLDVAIKIYDKKDPEELHHRLYGVRNICLMEYENLLEARKKCPQIINSLQEPIGVTKTPSGLDLLVTKLILDDDGRVSSELKLSRDNINQNFLSELKGILYFLGKKEIYHMDLNQGDNILVQINPGIHPRIIDFHITDKYYPWLKLTKYLGIDSAKGRYLRRVNRLLDSLK